MKTKKCFKCGKELDIDQFYIHKQMKDGRLNKCKACTREDVRVNRLKNIERYREYDKDRQKKKSRRDSQKEYRKNYKRLNSEAMRAHNAVARAIAKGEICRSAECESCGSRYKGTLQAHHDDYSKPLDVTFLCPSCHAERHRQLDRLGKASVRKPSPGPYKSAPNGRNLEQALMAGSDARLD